jgi:hypothetical protein
VLPTALVMAQAELPHEVLDLSRINLKMRQNLDQQPDYTCLETIARSHRGPGAGPFRPVDMVRLEVTRIGNKEFYSWPGARRFEGDIGDIVGSGTISSGEYSSHARDVFANPAAQFRYAGQEMLKGRQVLKYDYRLASFASGWRLKFLERSGPVAAYGSFWADVGTQDVLRLDAHADEIPPELPFIAASSEIEYGKVRIGDANLLLPQTARLSVSKRDGEDRNEVGFSQCRAYSTQSAIRFDTDSRTDSAASTDVEEFALAPNVSISLELTQGIDSKSAAGGDLITARVVADAKLKNQVIVPKGAIARGRIRRMERYTDPRPHFIVGLEFLEIEFGNKRGTFSGRLDRIDPVPGLSWVLSSKKASSAAIMTPTGFDQVIEGETLSTNELPGVGTFFLEGAHFRLQEGLQMVWRTMELKAPAPRR